MKKRVGAIVAIIATAVVMIGIANFPLITKATEVLQKTVSSEENDIVIHYQWKGEQPYLYYENVNDEVGTGTGYPGIPMTKEAEGWYTYTIKNANTAEISFIVPSASYQTAYFTQEAGEWWLTEDCNWLKSEPTLYTKAMEDAAAEREANGLSDREIILKAMNSIVHKMDAEESITIHYSSDWSSVSLYAWNALPQDVDFAWPGETLKKTADGYYTYTFNGVSKVNFLFTDGSNRSEEFSLKEAGTYWYVDGEWTTTEPGTPTTGPVATASTTTGPIPSVVPIDGSADFRDESIYFVITTRFYDGDSTNNFHCSDENAQTSADDPAWRGDFKGLIEKLDYIKALGFSAVWITPVVENRSGLDYHGYHAYNFTKVDSRYESDGVTYQDLINAAHEKGIKIIQDVVFNHTCNWGEENLMQITDEVYAGGRSEVVASGKYDDPDNPIYHHNGFCGSNDYDEYTAQNKTIADDCFDLETENPVVYNYLVDCYKKYINMGVDAFRIDTVKHISRLTLNSVFIPELKKTGGDSFYMFGEVCTKGHDVWYREHPPISTCFYTWKETGSWTTAWTDSWSQNESLVEQHYTDHLSTSDQPTSDNAFLHGNEYHTPDYSQSSDLSVIDFQMHWSFENAGSAYSMALQEDQYFNDSTWNVVYVDSHDYGPDSCYDKRYTGGTDAWAENLDLMFTFRGIPCVFYGSEVEFKAGQPIDKGGAAPLETTGRAYFGDYIEGSVNVTDFGVYSNATGAIADTLNSTLSKHIQRLNLIRRAVPALRKGQYSTEGCNGGMAFKRRYTDNNTDSFACVTISGDATFTGIPSGTYVELITGEKVECNGTLNASCSGRGNMRVYVLQTAGAPSGKIGENGDYLK